MHVAPLTPSQSCEGRRSSPLWLSRFLRRFHVNNLSCFLPASLVTGLHVQIPYSGAPVMLLSLLVLEGAITGRLSWCSSSWCSTANGMSPQSALAIASLQVLTCHRWLSCPMGVPEGRVHKPRRFLHVLHIFSLLFLLRISELEAITDKNL